MIGYMRIIILGGLKHCGKTSLGRTLSQRLGCHFFDLDSLMLESTGERWGSVREIWKAVGPDEFVVLEEQAMRNFIDWIMPTLKSQTIILSLGGGTIENSNAMNLISEYGLKVYIRADAEMLYQRIMRKGKPPFLSEKQPRKDFSIIYKRRHKLYEEYADICVDTYDVPLRVNAQRLLVEVENYYAGK